MDKYAGAIAGLHLSPNEDAGMSFEQVAFSSNVEELLMVQDPSFIPPDSTMTTENTDNNDSSATVDPKMVLLQAQIDPNTGEILWLPTSLSIEESHNQTIAKSQMSGMLRDYYRNKVYREAITKCIQKFMTTFKNKAPTVLDIGSGTGLLSILAAQAGAKHVYGIEQFTPLAHLSEQVVQNNALPSTNRVTILNSHSAEVNIGIRGTNASTNIPMKTDLVISEIVDSALLGEGIIPALKDAYSRLVDCSLTNTAGILPCVPVRAKVYGQLIYAESVSLWQDSQRTILRENIPSDNTNFTMGRTDWEPTCSAQPITLPLHIRALLNSTDSPVKVVSEPFIAAELDFTPKGLNAGKKPGSKLAPSATVSPNAGKHATCIKQTVSDNGITERILLVNASSNETMIGHVSATKGQCSTTANAVLYWWDLVLWEDKSTVTNTSPSSTTNPHPSSTTTDETTAIVYSTVPVDHYSVEGTHSSWQDHWVQCIQPLPVPVTLNASVSTKQFTVATVYNETAFSFYVAPGEAEVWSSKPSRAQAITKNPSLASTNKPLLFTEPEICVCGLHTLYTHERRWMLADPQRTHLLRTVIDEAIRSTAIEKIKDMKSLLQDADIDDDEDGGVRDIRIRVLDASDGSFCGLLAATTPNLPEGCSTYVFSLEKGDASIVHAQALATHAHIADRFAVLADYACYEVTSDVLAMAEATVTGVNAELTDEADIIDLTVGDNNVDQTSAEGENAEGKVTENETKEEEKETQSNPDNESKEDNVNAEDETEDAVDDQLVYVSATAGVTIDILVAEPWYQQMTTVPLWMVPAFWYRRTALQHTLSSKVRIIPAGATVYGQLVHFTHLQKGHGPIGKDGAAAVHILHEPYDKIVKDYTKYTYSFPLWQYEYTLIDKPIVLSRMDFTEPAPLPHQPWPNTTTEINRYSRDHSSSSSSSSATTTAVLEITSTSTDQQKIKDYYSTKVSIYNPKLSYRVGSEHQFDSIGTANGIIYWITFHLTSLDNNEHILSTGPLPNNQPTYWRQMVRFLSTETMEKGKMTIGLYLNEEKGTFEFVSE